MPGQVHDHISSQFESFAEGDPSGFTWLFRSHYAALMHYADNLLRDKQTAEEVVQHCFVKLWEKKPALKNEGALRVYLYRMVRNGCFDLYKTRKRHRRIEQQLPIDIMEEAIIPLLIRSELLRQLFNAMNELPAGCAKVVKMYYSEGKDYKEIAEDLSISVNTVRNQRKKGIDILRKKFPNMVLLLGICQGF